MYSKGEQTVTNIFENLSFDFDLWLHLQPFCVCLLQTVQQWLLWGCSFLERRFLEEHSYLGWKGVHSISFHK